MNVKKNYKILLFDLDDTLIDNRANVRAAFDAMLRANNQLFSEDNFDRWYR